MRTQALIVTSVLGVVLAGGTPAMANGDHAVNPPQRAGIAGETRGGDRGSPLAPPDHRVDVSGSDRKTSRPEAARAALAEAEGLFSGEPGRGLDGPRPLGDATMVLRELALGVDHLTGSEREQARRMLARPSSPNEPWVGFDAAATPKRQCSDHVCIHWVETGDDKTTQEWADTSAGVFDNVWREIVDQRGYRAPLDDSASPVNGGDGKLDIYLAELGSLFLYGYCTTDDPDLTDFAVSAYCVIDNDFARSQFGVEPIASLRVTAAHEFFHAVQFAYDIGEDIWMMEGTAAWVEDVVYDGINDNLQYLATSPLSFPDAPLDFAGQGDTFIYGSWVFWKFLTEYNNWGDQIVRDAWELAAEDGWYSLRVLEKVVADRGARFDRVFARFGAINRTARQWYEEGKKYPNAPRLGSFTLTDKRARTGKLWVFLFHLSNANIDFARHTSVKGKRKLQIMLNLPHRSRGSHATVTVHRKNGTVRRIPVKLGENGDGSIRVAFARAVIKRVTLTLTNSSTRTSCGQGTGWSCEGTPRDDDTRYVLRVRMMR